MKRVVLNPKKGFLNSKKEKLSVWGEKIIKRKVKRQLSFINCPHCKEIIWLEAKKELS